MEDFDSLRGRYEHVYVQSGRLFEGECSVIEKALEESFSAYYSLSKKQLDQKEQFLLAFFFRNNIYLSATYQLIRSGMLDPAGNNMRTLFETIIWQYAYLLDEDIYRNFVELNTYDSEKFQLVKTGKWSNTKERRLENLRRKYSFQKMMRKLYSKKTFEQFFFNQYWVLCQKSHSSIFGVNNNTPNMEGKTTLEKRPQEIKDNLTVVAYLAAENLICFLNCFHKHIEQSEIDAMMAKINDVNGAIPPANSLAPDTKKMEFSIRLREL